MTLKAYLNRFRSVKHSNCAMSWSGTFRWYCSQSCVYSDKTTWCLWWKIPLENPWKGDFRDSAFQNVPRCLGPKKLVASLFWCEFQSRLLFIVSLKGGWRMVPRKMWVSENFGPISKSQERFLRVSKSRFREFFLRLGGSIFLSIFLFGLQKSNFSEFRGTPYGNERVN